jgi:hypothetical protein
MHLKTETLRSYLDNALLPSHHLQVKTHLSTCSQCSQDLELIRQRAKTIEMRLETLDALPIKVISAKQAYARFRNESEVPMKTNPFGQLRPVWSILALAAVLAVALSFQPVRTAASNFLHLFRVQQVEILPLDVQSVENFGHNQTLAETMGQVFSDSIVFTQEKGETQTGLDLASAQGTVSYPIRLPEEPSPVDLNVEAGAAFEFTVAIDQIQAIMDAANITDIQLPPELDNAVFEVEIPDSIAANYGQCVFPEITDPDQHPSRFDMKNCIVLLQSPSPTLSTTSEVDPAFLAEIGLRVLGMGTSEAKAFSQSVDWASTLVVPVPVNQAEYEDISVDGVTGKLIKESNVPDEITNYTILWVKDGMIYSVFGTGNPQDGLDLVSSFK